MIKEIGKTFLTGASRDFIYKHSCKYQIDEGKIAIRDRNRRHKLHADIGVEYGQCGRPITHEIDGVGFCKPHAGLVCLEIVMEAERAATTPNT